MQRDVGTLFLVAAAAFGPPLAFAQAAPAAGADADALANHLVAVAGDDDRADVNATFIQPFLTKALGRGATASVSFESTYDWEWHAWNLPLNVAYTKVTRIGKQMVSFASGARVYFERRKAGPTGAFGSW